MKDLVPEVEAGQSRRGPQDRVPSPWRPPFHRIVDGAIRNARHSHSDIKITRSQRQSIVKRAAGTLSAFWADALAAGPSHGDQATGFSPDRKLPPATMGTAGRGAVAKRRSPLTRLKDKLRHNMWRIKRTEHPEYTRAIIDVLRMIDALPPAGGAHYGVHGKAEGLGAQANKNTSDPEAP